MNVELDHFEELEEKIEHLIAYISSLKEDKDTLGIKNKALEEKIRTISIELDSLKQDREEAKSRIIALLGKMEKLDI